MNNPFGTGWTRTVCNNLQLKQEDMNEFEDDEDEESQEEIERQENRRIDDQEHAHNRRTGFQSDF